MTHNHNHVKKVQELLNQHEPFAVIFGVDEDRGVVTLDVPNALALLTWVRRYNTDLRLYNQRLKDLQNKEVKTWPLVPKDSSSNDGGE